MFNLSGSELVFLVLIALVVLGPDKLPDAMRKAGKAYADFKKMTSGFQSEMRSVLDEPMRELRETAELAKKAASWDANVTDTKPVSGSMAAQTPSVQTPFVQTPLVQTPTTSETAVPSGSDAPPRSDAPPTAADATSRRLQADSAPVADAPKPFSPNFASAAPRVTPPVEIDEVSAE